MFLNQRTQEKNIFSTFLNQFIQEKKHLILEN